ncbi:hypothetical protein IAR55_003431 [Kwoniella newhampshirensis]|uniref:PHD-type domain-containing protein n=1 Tax=Kwoniella newhampshirensis TaxID=1651941 RepID=A0AAW0YYM6_9TREE
MATSASSHISNQRGEGSEIHATATLVNVKKPVILGDPVSSESPTPPPSPPLISPPPTTNLVRETASMDVDHPMDTAKDRPGDDDSDRLPPTSISTAPRINTPLRSAVAGPSRTTRQSTLSADRSKRVGEGFWKRNDAAEQDKDKGKLLELHTTHQSTVAVKPDENGDIDMGADEDQDDDESSSKAVETPPPVTNTPKGISLVFRRPPATTGEGSRASTPDMNSGRSASANSGSKKKNKRMSDSRLVPTRATRGRRSSPGPSTSQASRATSLSRSQGPLSIFAPPPPADTLPEALQSAIGVSTPIAQVDANAPAADADAIRREAAAGFESRLRSRGTQKRDGGERTGVSASGKDVRVGGSSRATAQNSVVAAVAASGPSKKKGKAKADVEVPNQDFCSACRGIGRFLCCDGCPRSFHFMCLEPPLRIDELPDEEIWYCKKCRAQKEKDLKPIPSIFKSICKKIDEENPAQFRLPQELRTYFVGVATAQRGEYVDADETRTKYDRKGFQEERDPFRIRDGKQKQIACYVCNGSSLPLHSLTTDPESAWRQIVTCDYCNLSWHLDCLTPPLSSMPNSARKWMCPNHVEQVMPRRRTVRNNLEFVDVETPGERNNGNIQIVADPEESRLPDLEYEDMVINRKKFRVPERVIKLDFWDKIKTMRTIQPDFPSPASVEDVPPSQDELDAASLVLALSRPVNPLPTPATAPAVNLSTNGNGNGHRRGRSGDMAFRNSEAVSALGARGSPAPSAAVNDNGKRRKSRTPQSELTTTTRLPTPPPLHTPPTHPVKSEMDEEAAVPTNRPKIVLRMPNSNSGIAGVWKVNGEGK